MIWVSSESEASETDAAPLYVGLRKSACFKKISHYFVDIENAEKHVFSHRIGLDTAENKPTKILNIVSTSSRWYNYQRSAES